MSRYSRYFLQNILWLDDGLCRYYVQDPRWCQDEILDVPVAVYDQERDAEQMLWACMEYNTFFVADQLRAFLTDDCYGYHFVHKMSDQEVVKAVADELTHHIYNVVIEPGSGRAVHIDGITDHAAVPVAVEPEPELATIFEELKEQLDGLVAEQQKKYDQYEAQLSKMSEAEKAALYGKKAGTGSFSFVGDIVNMVKAFPGFYAGYLKTVGKIALYPSQLSSVMAESVATGSLGPLEAEIDKFVKPIAQTHEDAKRYKSMLQVLLTDKETLELMHDFAERYYAATHPLELTEMGASAATDIVVTVLLAIFTAGVGTAANVAAKSTKVVRVAKLLERLARVLKRIGHQQKVPGSDMRLGRPGMGHAHMGIKPNRVNQNISHSGLKPDTKGDLKREAIDNRILNKKGDGPNDVILDSDDLATTLKQQNSILKKKQMELDNWDDEAKANFNRWFGTTDDNARRIVQERTGKMIDLNENYIVDNFKPADPSKEYRYAYVYPNDTTHTIYLDKEFLNAGTKAPDSKAGVVTHEMSHFVDVGGTKDFVYGTDGAKELSKIEPQDALMNADNYEYYIEDVK